MFFLSKAFHIRFIFGKPCLGYFFSNAGVCSIIFFLQMVENKVAVRVAVRRHTVPHLL